MRQAPWARWMLLLNEHRAPREQASKAALFAIALHVPTRAPQTSCASSLRAPRPPFARLHLLPSAPNISRAQRHVIESPKSITNKRADGPLPSASRSTGSIKRWAPQDPARWHYNHITGCLTSVPRQVENPSLSLST